MPVSIHPKGTPLPADHPLRGTLIHFGIKRPIDQHEVDKVPVKESLPNVYPEQQS